MPNLKNPHSPKFILLIIYLSFSFIHCTEESIIFKNDTFDQSSVGLEIEESQIKITKNLSVNIIDNPADYIIISPDEFVESYERLANWRKRMGLNAKVVPLSEIREKTTGNDLPESVKEYLEDEYKLGRLKYVLLGGDAEFIPFKRIKSSYSTRNALNTITTPELIDLFELLDLYKVEEFSSNGPVDLYYADLDGSDWDKNKNRKFGEKSDVELKELRNPEIAIGRYPASRAEDVDDYIDKVIGYEDGIDGGENRLLMLSDVARNLSVLGDVDSGEAIEWTLTRLMPFRLFHNIEKLYAEEDFISKTGAKKRTDRRTRKAFRRGSAIAIHEGHGSFGTILMDYDKNDINRINSDYPPILVSTACYAGNFADRANSFDADGWALDYNSDSAGERFVVSKGAGVAYIGNVSAGLGPLGGAQILQGVLEGILAHGKSRLGDALNYARRTLRDQDVIISRNIFVDNIWVNLTDMIEDNAEWYTQMNLTLLGDPALKVWTGPVKDLYLEANDTYQSGYNKIEVKVRDGNGRNVKGATLTLFKENEFLFSKKTNKKGKATFSFNTDSDQEIILTVSADKFRPNEMIINPD